ncbi:IclR family transcriptional regulator [Halopiger xanaduensis]|uniref:Transcriptional regulator, IclR family n=1 Tax=Halopiger xanaduensis (strain DSM 18323 / JCM 14033 / SH-6) TaxID=797210 RepID=F8DD74_HALXS|nr:IclR family transcriptional regulator [Halopiger xanaduensis]AEH38963.1 transcriptional regulator, IclR family [Halopiger xanaduensis SH-6]
MSPKAANPIKSTKTTFRIIEALKELDGAGVTELAEHLDLPKSNVHNYLSTLEEEEYVVKEGTTFHVGIRFLELGAYARSRRDLYDIARPEMDKIAEKEGELVNLLVEEHGRGTYVYRVAGDDAVEVDAHVGTRVYLHCTALGKAILAHMPEERVEEIIDQHGLPKITENTITDREALYARLEQVRKQGVAFDREERLEGLCCAAAPIRSDSGRVLGALSISGPTTRVQGDRLEEEIPSLLEQATNVIELNITYS